MFYNPPDFSNMQRTLDVEVKLAEMMMSWIEDGTISEDTLYGIEILNEPGAFYLSADEFW